MRLIDADDFFERIKNDTDLCAEMEIYGEKALKKYLDLQPTAYDMDKVIEELEIERKTANNTYNSFNMDVDLGRVFGLEKAIEIVKQGFRKDISE